MLCVAADVSARVVEVDDGSSHRVFAAGSGPRVHAGRTARANARICDRAFACSCLHELNVSVVADQLTLSSSRARARMFCYGIFTHPLSRAYERPAYRISLCVLACVGCGTRGRLLGLSGRICHKVEGERTSTMAHFERDLFEYVFERIAMPEVWLLVSASRWWWTSGGWRWRWGMRMGLEAHTPPSV